MKTDLSFIFLCLHRQLVEDIHAEVLTEKETPPTNSQMAQEVLSTCLFKKDLKDSIYSLIFIKMNLIATQKVY